MPNNNVAVIGLGATGAFVARAAFDLGYNVTVYVHGPQNNTPPGAFWLHWLPEDMTGEFSSKAIRIIGKGTPDNYTKLQWGPSWYKGLTSSFPKETVVESGYNPSEVLPKLVPDNVKIEVMTYPLSDVDVVDLSKAFRFTFQTFPRSVDFLTQPERIPFVAAAQWAAKDPDTNVVVYNGTGNGIVVREAYLFGNHFLEFPKHMSLQEVKKSYNLEGFHTVTLKDLAPNTQPISNDSARGVYLMGRYAQWDRRCLSHDCYHRTVDIIRQGEANG